MPKLKPLVVSTNTKKLIAVDVGFYKASEDDIEFSKGGNSAQINRAREWIRSHPGKVIDMKQLRMFGIL